MEVETVSPDVEPSLSRSDQPGHGDESNCSPLCSPRLLRASSLGLGGGLRWVSTRYFYPWRRWDSNPQPPPCKDVSSPRFRTPLLHRFVGRTPGNPRTVRRGYVRHRGCRRGDRSGPAVTPIPDGVAPCRRGQPLFQRCHQARCSVDLGDVAAVRVRTRSGGAGERVANRPAVVRGATFVGGVFDRRSSATRR
jgi:hypothetical protein